MNNAWTAASEDIYKAQQAECLQKELLQELKPLKMVVLQTILWKMHNLRK
jgi:hypothetical protein